MSKKTSYILGMLFTIIIGTLLYCYLCDDCHCNAIINGDTDTEVTDTIVDTPETDTKTTTFNPFNIIGESGDLGISSNDNFNFNLSSFSTLLPLSENLDGAIGKLKDYLTANPGKTVGVTGKYNSGETNNSAFPNLGLARANSVKNYLTLKGISSKYIDTYGELDDNLVASADNVLQGPVSFRVADSASSGEDLNAIRDEIRANPLVLHFNTGQASINLTADQRQKIAYISRYLDKVDGASCSVVGHTDSSGKRSTNIRLGQERADFGKAYLVRNGISDAKINTSSKGPDEPIADNSTEEGRAKNRRTVITIN